jgi:DnaJ-class molecular chaperone
MKNPYEVLGAKRDASQTDIKKKYRDLAKRLHPDRHPGDAKAEQKFKDVSAAYGILGDAKQRARFDRGEIDSQGNERMRAGFHGAYAEGAEQGFAGFGGAASGGSAGGFGFHFEDLISPLFRRPAEGAAAGARSGDRTARTRIGFIEAAAGGKKRMKVGGRSLEVAISPGVESGQTIRLKGQGSPSAGGRPAGDLLLTVQVAPHAYFTRKGDDIQLDLPVTLAEAVEGARVDVPTIHGRVSLNIPAGSNTGTSMRLKGKGIFRKGAKDAGNQIVRLQVTLPEDADADLQRFVEGWAAGKRYDPRKKLHG